MTTRPLFASALLLLTSSSALLVGCEKPKGACEVTYDMAGLDGRACVVTLEEECVDDVKPSINIMATTKKKAFTANKTCADAGYTTTSCERVPIAWSFDGNCPR